MNSTTQSISYYQNHNLIDPFSAGSTISSRAPQLMTPSQMSFQLESSHSKENGFPSLTKLQETENGIHDVIQQQSTRSDDGHLIEFSEAMRTVAKALRRVAEGKALAQEEAAEWKRKYELERARNSQHKSIESSQNGSQGIFEVASDEQLVQNSFTMQTERCCGKEGICSHQVLLNEAVDPKSTSLNNGAMEKVPFRLSWGCNGEKNGQHKHDVVSFERGDITTAGRSSKQIFLQWESRPQTVLLLTKPNSVSVHNLCAEMVRWLNGQKGINIVVEPRVRNELLAEGTSFNFVQSWENDEEISLLHTKVDLVITLGGDGTVLWAASLFEGPVPPMVPFSLGSLGFMTPFHSENYKDYLDTILKGPINITLRHRLQCHVIREAAKDELQAEEPILVLNEVTIDRGISSYLTNLECYCDNSFVTCVQGDGLIVSTTSGSTAYSLAAGGSMVHPQVPGILFTPICPHSLSFRPLILPEYVTLRIQVPFTSRGHAWASFDGKDRKQLAPGDALICSMAPWPVPTACLVDSTTDFLRSIHEGLHWNLRKSQSFDGPRDM